MKVSQNKERTSISIDPNLLRKAKALCRLQSIVLDRKYSLSEMIAEALKSHISKLEKKHSKDSTNGVVSNGQRPHV